MLDETLTVGAGPVRFREVFHVAVTEDLYPLLHRRELVCMVVRMSAFVTEYLHAPFRCPALHFQHLMQLELFQTRMSEIERERNNRRSFRREPLISEVAIGPNG